MSYSEFFHLNSSSLHEFELEFLGSQNCKKPKGNRQAHICV